MKRIVSLVLVMVILGTASAAWAQRGQGRGGRGGGGGGRGPGGDSVGLLSNKSVQEDLKITEEQVQKITQLSEKRRAAFGELRNLSAEERQAKFQEQAKETEKSVAEILTADQQKRVKQIGMQLRGTQAIGSAEVAEALNLTAEQKESIKSVQDSAGQEMRSLFQQGGGANREESRKKFQELRKSTEEKVTNLLTADQQSKWKEMVGEPFKGDLRAGFGGGGGRQRGQGGGQGGQGRQRPARSNTT